MSATEYAHILRKCVTSIDDILQQVLSAVAVGQRQQQLSLLDKDKGEKPASRWQANYAGAPRPPTMLKSHLPCYSTVPLDTQSFLRHLQALKWYNGQVGQQHVGCVCDVHMRHIARFQSV